MPTHATGFSFGRMYATFRPFFFICTQSFGHAYAIQMSPDPNASHRFVSDDQIRRTFFFFLISRSCDCLSCASRLVPRVLEAEVQTGDREHVQVVEPRDLALVAVVEDEAPRVRLRLHLVGAVEDRVEAPVVRDAVLLPAVLARLDHERVQVLEVRDQRRIPRLHEPARREVLHPADVRPEQIRPSRPRGSSRARPTRSSCTRTAACSRRASSRTTRTSTGRRRCRSRPSPSPAGGPSRRAEIARIASAMPVRPARTPAPPAAAAYLNSVWRSNRRSIVSSPSIPVALPS